MEYKSGFVAVIGRPNVGKSTLINKIIGQKIAITSDKPQTTRSRIRCILTQDDAQIIFLDTPGIHKPKFKLVRVEEEAPAQPKIPRDKLFGYGKGKHKLPPDFDEIFVAMDAEIWREVADSYEVKK